MANIYPEIREIIAKGKENSNPQANKLASELDTMLAEVLNSATINGR